MNDVDMRSGNQLKELRLILVLTFLLHVLASYQVMMQANSMGVLFLSRRWTGILALTMITAGISLGLFILTWTGWWYRVDQFFQEVFRKLAVLKWGNLILFLFSIAAFSWLLLGSLGYLFENYYVRLSIFWMVVLVGAGLIKAYLMTNARMMEKTEDTGLFWTIIASLILTGFGYQLAVMVPQISAYPFSMGWSETSRYYYASLFFAKNIDGMELTPSVLHPSRYLMQSIPFIVTGLPLWFHRFWQVFIWVFAAILTTYFLSRRLSLTSKKTNICLFLFIGWAYLFLFQGPVYYHLLVCVIVVLWGFNSHNFWTSLMIVLFASVWAGISRINWYPVPGLLAATIFFLEIEVPKLTDEGSNGSHLRYIALYLLKPVVWVGLGTLMAIGSQYLYVLWSGAEIGEFTSSFTSDLLWYRLLPNPTFPLGILPAILLISLPLLVLIIRRLMVLHTLRILGIGSILLTLFIGGVIVSTKIGGGSNLHNLDAYLVILLVVSGYVYFEKVIWESHHRQKKENVSRVLLLLIVLIPILYALSFGGPLILPEKQVVEQTLETLDEMTSEAVKLGGDVLLITERQLITFGMLKEIPLVEKFETVYLMEMAMSGNDNYLSDFHASLSEQDYALIVTDQQRINYKGREYAFGEENDVWVAEVTVPLLKYYQREELFNDIGIEVLIPKD